MKAEIVSIGRELLMGETADTNATYIAKQLPSLGIDLVWVSQVGDNQSQMVEVFKRAWSRSDLTITTGGLGPTGDDLTREAIAELLGEKIVVITQLEKDLRERFKRFGMQAMPESNLKQCTLIQSAKAIPNPQGTAPGWWVEKDGHLIACMPGPPREMYDMWQNEVRPRLQQISKVVILARTWKTFGYSEAAVGELAFPLFPTNNPSLGVYAKPDGIQLQLKVTADKESEARRLLAEGESKIRQAFENTIWGVDDESLETVIGRMMVEKELSLAVMEDYTGGLLATGLAAVPDSQRFFNGGLLAQTDKAKIALGVSAATIAIHGLVNQAIALEMAEVARQRMDADIGIGVTGSGPVDQPVVHVAILNGKREQTIARPRGKERVVTAILFELRRLLLEIGKR
jgi:nicotinamide-nucleotide amidase